MKHLRKINEDISADINDVLNIARDEGLYIFTDVSNRIIIYRYRRDGDLNPVMDVIPFLGICREVVDRLKFSLDLDIEAVIQWPIRIPKNGFRQLKIDSQWIALDDLDTSNIDITKAIVQIK